MKLVKSICLKLREIHTESKEQNEDGPSSVMCILNARATLGNNFSDGTSKESVSCCCMYHNDQLHFCFQTHDYVLNTNNGFLYY